MFRAFTGRCHPPGRPPAAVPVRGTDPRATATAAGSGSATRHCRRRARAERPGPGTIRVRSVSASAAAACRCAGRRVVRHVDRRLAAWPTPRRTDRRRARSRTRPGSTGSSTRPAGSSTSARPSRCGSRLSSYFQDLAHLHPRTQHDGHQRRHGSTGRWCGTEVEALQLEYTWIKEYDPRFNVKYRDDKSYPWLAVTMQRGVPAGHGRARAEAQGGPVLRPVQPRLGDPRDRRPAAAGLPDALVLGGGVQAVRARSAGRACWATSASAPPRASAGSPPRSTATIVDDFVGVHVRAHRRAGTPARAAR